MKNDYEIVISIDTDTQWIDAQTKLFSLGYKWVGSGEHLVKRTHQYLHVEIFEGRKILSLDNLSPAKHIPIIPYINVNWKDLDCHNDPINIEIAEDSYYVLYTNKDGTRFSAGCHAELTRENALSHWSYEKACSRSDARRVRAAGFHKAITDYIYKIDSTNLEIMEAKANLIKAQADLDLAIKREEQKEKELTSHKRFIPEKGEEFYATWSDGTVSETLIHSGGKYHKRYALIGNAYRTKEEAEKAIAKQKAIVRIRDIIEEANGDWVLNWKVNTNKYHLSYSRRRNHLEYLMSQEYDFSSLFPVIKDKDTFDKIKKQITNEDIEAIWDVKL